MYYPVRRDNKKEVINMPGGDRTGPWGGGPMTGRAAGYCAGYTVPGYMNPGSGRGLGRGMGWGRGRGFGRGMGRGGFRWQGAYPYGVPYYPAQLSPKDEADMLKSQVDALKQELEDIQNRISVLEKTEVKESN
jgi:hypothetical protein